MAFAWYSSAARRRRRGVREPRRRVEAERLGWRAMCASLRGEGPREGRRRAAPALTTPPLGEGGGVDVPLGGPHLRQERLRTGRGGRARRLGGRAGGGRVEQVQGLGRGWWVRWRARSSSLLHGVPRMCPRTGRSAIEIFPVLPWGFGRREEARRRGDHARRAGVAVVAAAAARRVDAGDCHVEEPPGGGAALLDVRGDLRERRDDIAAVLGGGGDLAARRGSGGGGEFVVRAGRRGEGRGGGSRVGEAAWAKRRGGVEAGRSAEGKRAGASQRLASGRDEQEAAEAGWSAARRADWDSTGLGAHLSVGSGVSARGT